MLEDDCGWWQTGLRRSPITPIVPDVVSFLVQISMASSTWYVAIDLANAFSSIPTKKQPSLETDIHWKETTILHIGLGSRLCDSPTLCHNTV